jgi:hypothetical protein
VSYDVEHPMLLGAVRRSRWRVAPMDRFSHPVDQALQREILLDCEVAGDLLSGGDQGVPEQGVVAGEERHGMVVGPHEVTWVVGMAGECLADKARPFASAPLIGCVVDRLAPRWRPRSGVNGLGRRLSMVMLCGGRNGLVDRLLGNGRVEELAAQVL